ncbi:MAG: hypothetical protein AAF846_01070 [Chloroflexota bacterium]
MAWTEPTTWQAGDPLTADRLNTEVKDNLLVLKNPAKGIYRATGWYQSTATGWNDIDATNLSFTLDTNGGDIQISFLGYIYGDMFFDVELDGQRLGGSSGIYARSAVNVGPVSFSLIFTDISAGSHTFKWQWKRGGSAGTIQVQANSNSYTQFAIREVN